MLSPEFKEFVELLIENKAEYLVVGGYAVGFYGHPRYTGDLDIWVNPTPENANRVAKAVEEFGFGSFKLTEADFQKKDIVVQLGYPPLRIDIVTGIDGVEFEDCFRNRITAAFEDIQISFISYKDLVKNKKASGRPIDLDDVDKMKE